MVERNAWGFSLFCDDLRAEVGGKISLMGMYQNDLIVQQDFPLVLSKFAILVKYYEIPNMFKDDLVINVYLPGDAKDSPSIKAPLPRAQIQEAKSPYELEEDQERVYHLTMPVVLSPLAIAKEGFIKVRAVCGETTTNLGSLMFRKIRPEDKIAGITA